MKKKVVIGSPWPHPSAETMLRGEKDLIDLVYVPNDRETFFMELATAAAALPPRGTGKPPPDKPWIISASFGAKEMDLAPKLEVLGNVGSGVDNIDMDAATERGILICNSAGVRPWRVAEHMLALMIDVNKKITHSYIHLRDGKGWPTPGSWQGRELYGRTAGIVGLGAIGSELAKMCKGLNMKVIAFDPYVSKDRMQTLGVTKIEKLHDMLPQCDFVCVIANLTKETYHIMGAKELSLMRKDAYIVESSRGGLIDEKALIEALKKGTIAGAGLDSLDPEPPAKDNPLFFMNNAVITPHHAGITEEMSPALGWALADSIITVLKGQKPVRLANPGAWPKYLSRMGRKA